MKPAIHPKIFVEGKCKKIQRESHVILSESVDVTYIVL